MLHVFTFYLRRARVLSSPFVIFVLSGSPAPWPVVSTCCCTGLVRVGLKFPLNGNRANVYAHVVVVRGHVWIKKIRGHQPVWGLKRYYPHIRYEYYWIVTRSTCTRSTHCDVNSDAPVVKNIYYIITNYRFTLYTVSSVHVCANVTTVWKCGYPVYRKLTFIHQ